MSDRVASLTVADIEAGYARAEWRGWGYLGERKHATTLDDPEITPVAPERVAAADAAILRVANAEGWTADELFAWCNSAVGRWFADHAFGGFPLDTPAARELLRRPVDER